MSPGSSILAAVVVIGLGVAAVSQLRDEGDEAGAVPSTTVAAATTTAPPPLPPDSSLAPTPVPTTVAPVAAATTEPSGPAAVALPVGLPADGYCPEPGRAAVVDRDRQLTWLCADGVPAALMPITSAWSMPDPGDYAVYAKDLQASSTFGGAYSTMTHFVAFSYGENTGARVAFHSVPRYPGGGFVQPLESVGDLGRRGESSGCIRVLPDDAVAIWDWLAIGDAVRVIS